ncbi:MAG: DUF4399 domain-containing protein [Gemmatimonadales bacterium]
MPRATATSFVSSLASVLVITALGCGGEANIRASVEIVEPANEAAVDGPDVRVALAATGVEIAPAADEREGTAHHHLFVDRSPTALDDTIPAGLTGIIHLGRAQTEFTLKGLAPGEHTVIAVLANWAHVPLSPPAVDTVRFTVRP